MASSIPIVQEDTLQVDNISLLSHCGRTVDTSVDDEPESGLELTQHVAIDTQSQRVSLVVGGLYDNLIGTCN